MTMSIVICTLHKILSGDQIKENELANHLSLIRQLKNARNVSVKILESVENL
jgi:predicted transcriptional regulator